MGTTTSERGELAETELPVGVWGCSQSTESGRGRYRIVQMHATGGLGVVYVAVDDELHRKVALKTVQSRFLDSPEGQRRFLREAETTAALEHPGIVPIYGLGSDEHGHPFYAMRFINGFTLKEAIARFHQDTGASGPARTSGEWKLELLKLLERFIAVCNTVAYAHSRGFLHRDLKPGNVMLGAYGETLVLDWGLAKPLDRSVVDLDPEDRTLVPLSHENALLTEVGGIVGTPAYMSPEQAAGCADRLGPASDVYSLGATLYTLLTGRTPFEESHVAAILNRVRAGDFVLPMRANPRIPQPLEMICLKAMALQPEARYPSARELAEDVERWIAGEPVTAWRESVSQRFGRWARHHRSVLVSVLSVLLSAAVGLATFAALEASKRQHRRIAAELARTEEKLARAEDRLGGVSRLLGWRDEAAAHYERARDAWQRLAAGYTAVDGYRRALDESRRQIDSLLTEPAPNGFSSEVPDHRASLARSYYRLGIVQGEARDPQGAAGSFHQAIAIYTELSAAQPKVMEYLHGLAASYTNLGVVQNETRDHQGAAESYRQAILSGSALVAAWPKVPECQDVLARSYTNLSVVERALGELKRAEESARQAIEIETELVESYPDATDYLSMIGCAFDALGAAIAAEDRQLEAERAYRRAIERQRIAIVQSSDVTEFRQRLSSHYAGLARTLRAQGRVDEAVRTARQRRELWQNNSRDRHSPEELYSTACDLALCLPIARNAAGEQALIAEVLATLRAAMNAGWRDAAQASRDAALIPLRHHDDFRHLLDEVFDRSFPADPFRW